MRKSKVETAETRKRIVEVAARAFRDNGIHATGLVDVMSKAGLSHGGFYRHFGSKDQLVAEACEAGLTTMIGELEAVAHASDCKDSFGAIVEAYVSAEHRDAPAGGCPLAGMGSELARADEQTRAAASHGFDELVEMLAKRVGRRPQEAARSEAVFALAAMIGAITMSRIVTDPDASLAVLQNVKHHLARI
jgi:TetR/AcrR family transcriptional repressor of nem operon